MDYDRDEESPAARIDRNYAELLQELRVAQTGVQVLFAFLLTIAFQRRFAELAGYQHAFYVAALVSSALAAVLLIAPAAAHRMLFRHHLKDELVELTSRLAATGLVFLAVAVLSALFFVVDVVTGMLAAGLIAGAVAAVVVVVWYVVPWQMRRHHPEARLWVERDEQNRDRHRRP